MIISKACNFWPHFSKKRSEWCQISRFFEKKKTWFFYAIRGADACYFQRETRWVSSVGPEMSVFWLFRVHCGVPMLRSLCMKGACYYEIRRRNLGSVGVAILDDHAKCMKISCNGRPHAGHPKQRSRSLKTDKNGTRRKNGRFSATLHDYFMLLK